MNLKIRSEIRDDGIAIHHLHEQAFGGPAEANLVLALRAGGYKTVSLVATANNQLVGHIFLSRVTIQIEDGSLEILSLAPLAVLPDFQR